MYGGVALQPAYPPEQFISIVQHVEQAGMRDL
jgi:hypothetical protein